MSLDWSKLRELAAMTDAAGVLSVYVTADPHDEKSQPAWRLRAYQQLKRLREDVKSSASRERYKAVSERLEAIEGDIEGLLDSRAPGLGRALFTTISDGKVEQFSLQVPLTDEVTLGPTPRLRPLVTALSTAGPTGAVVVGADEIRIIDLRLGFVDDVATIPHPADLADRRELTGRGSATPTTTPHSSASHHDLFEKREEDRLLRYLHSAGPKIAAYARKLNWVCLGIAGEAKYAHATTEGLPSDVPADVVTMPHAITSLSLAKLAASVEPELARARARHHLQLAERVRDGAFSSHGGTAACGLAPTLAALQEGRVGHLLLAQDGQWAGSRTPDGMLVPDSEVPPGTSAEDLTPESRLDERMIELAFREGAAITILDATAAAPFADVEGIGALLRW